LISVTILGATGSIGSSTLDVISQHPEKYELYALTAHTSWEKLAALCIAHRPRFAVLVDGSHASELVETLRKRDCATDVLIGEEALVEVAEASQVDYVMAAIVGAAGLPSTLAAAKSGKRILLANKESLVMAGGLFMRAVEESGAELLPIDSEHNAVFQCLPRDSNSLLNRLGVTRILLTASGGPFRDVPLSELDAVTPEQAAAHPNWDMGKKISVDSATMMNKGLEVIEARWLFGAKPQEIEVVVHPQSIVHSLVRYSDGSVLAQLGNPDMRTPIAHALGWPERIESGVEPLDLLNVQELTFTEPDLSKFPSLRLAYEAVAGNEDRSIALNASNEVAVEAFLKKQISFTSIPKVVESTLENCDSHPVDSIDDVLAIDALARIAAAEQLRVFGFQ